MVMNAGRQVGIVERSDPDATEGDAWTNDGRHFEGGQGGSRMSAAPMQNCRAWADMYRAAADQPAGRCLHRVAGLIILA